MQKKDNHIFIRTEALRGEHLLMRVLIAGVFMCVLGYAYFVSVSIMNVIAFKEANAASDSLRTEVGLLEESYFDLAKSVTPERGGHLGLVPVEDATYVRKPGTVGVALMPRAGI